MGGATIAPPVNKKKKMMKKICFLIGLFFISCNISIFAQGNEVDAYTLSNAGLGGTARSISMGGAFGALGGDMSVISSNPAGLGIYRSSEVSGTFDFSIVNTSSNWDGNNSNRSKIRFAPINFGFELYFPVASGSIKNWNLGFSYNRLKTFNRKYSMIGSGQPYSISEYIASLATNAFVDRDGNYSGIPESDLIYGKGNDPYDKSSLSGHWLPILGYEAGMYGNMIEGGTDGVYQSAFGSARGNNWDVNKPNMSTLSVAEGGSIDEYNIGFGMNVSDFLFLGTSISVTTIDYKYTSGYIETFSSGNSKEDNLFLRNWLNTEGTAFSANLGAIMNFNLFRLGVAYNSPRYYEMTDFYDAYAGTYINSFTKPSMENCTPENSYSEYEFQTPGKWIFSGSAIIGQSALLSFDYEIMNYSKMKYFGKDYDNDRYEYATNDMIREDYSLSHTFKVGTEIKINPQLAVRAGYLMQTSPMKEQLVNNDVEVFSAGTIPHFTVTQKPTNYYTAGLGYRFTPNFYMDFACVFRYNTAKAYAFSSTPYNEPKYDIYPVYSNSAKLTTKTTRLIFTLGYKY